MILPDCWLLDDFRPDKSMWLNNIRIKDVQKMHDPNSMTWIDDFDYGMVCLCF